ncbi:MAG: Asp-tRNA(Asn)/Glu-tRNA(Gln) amidotransferase subunit GatC [Zavarzinella sp.]
MQIDDVRKIANLARLELSEQDLAVMAEQLTSILDYVQQLDQLDTSNVEPLAHPLPIANIFREDEPAGSIPVEEALMNSPARTGDFFSVPSVFDNAGDSGH